MGIGSELEKLRLRREIMAKIQKLLNEIREVRELIQAFSSNGRIISAAMSNWENQFKGYQSTDLAPDISIINNYEGTSAVRFAGELPQATSNLAAACSQMQAVSAGVQDQITRLEEYMNKLSVKVAELRAQLASL